MSNSNRSLLFWVSLSLVFLPGWVHAYLLMPFPGSQDIEAIKFCYYLEKIITPLRILGGLLLLLYAVKYFSKNTTKGKIIKTTVLVLALATFYVTDFHFKASTMFEEPKTVRFANALINKVPLDYLVLGVEHNGVAKAYPIIYLGYHHKVQDDVGSLPVLVTYCTMCRTGRVFSPVINGQRQMFRLVGARHYNAIIEDSATGSWWYQATGEAVVGPLQGKQLTEVQYEQSTLSAWLFRHPGSLILQPDNYFKSDYADLKDYDRKQAVDRDSTLKNKDSLVRKSWVIGLVINKQPKAYNWRKLEKARLVNDQVGSVPVLVAIEKDKFTFHAWNRNINGAALNFNIATNGRLADKETGSVWNWEGTCDSGKYKGSRLSKIQAYQEYRHSWLHFHPGTLLWE